MAGGQPGDAECRTDQREQADQATQSATTGLGSTRVQWPQEDLYNTIVQVPACTHPLPASPEKYSVGGAWTS